MIDRFGISLAWLLFVGFVTMWAPTNAQAACVEIKNDTFDQEQKTPVKAVRSFCIAEQFGAIFTAEKDLLIQKIRMLISGDGKNLMESTTVQLRIYKEKAPGSAEPGQEIGTETPYQVPATTSPNPYWLEIADLNIDIKKGESFRIVFNHDTIDCELRVTPGEPLCADSCNWWSATVDSGPVKDENNVVNSGSARCQENASRQWRLWKDLPAACKPAGNLIIRALAYDKEGQDCKGGGTTGCTPNAQQACKCGALDGTQTCNVAGTAFGECKCSGGNQSCTPGSQQACKCGADDGTQTCNAAGTAFGECQCSGTGGVCTPGATVKCACPGGADDGTQTCNATGTALGECQCGTQTGGKPTVTQITPNTGEVGKNTQVTIIGQNFVDGAKVRLGTNIEALNVSVVGATTITAIIPAEAPAGTYNLTVTNPDGQEFSLLEAFTIGANGGCGCVTQGNTPHPVNFLVWLGVFLLISLRRKQDHD